MNALRTIWRRFTGASKRDEMVELKQRRCALLQKMHKRIDSMTPEEAADVAKALKAD